MNTVALSSSERKPGQSKPRWPDPSRTNSHATQTENPSSGSQPKKSTSKELRAYISPMCRAEVIKGVDAADCLAEPIFYCEHRHYFGRHCFCMHPQKHEIAARTKAGERAKELRTT